jgi:16S rRNA (guanine966-N2)-methyltransferase
MSRHRAHKQRTLRIVGGQWRGRRFAFPAGTEVRPTPDRVRETLFNWLGGVIEGADCLDLFAGSGMLGLEALSRGAASVCFVEHDTRLAAALREHLDSLGARAAVHERDAVRFLARAPGRAFDVAFVDPPYATPLPPLLDAVRPHLRERARVYVERPGDEGLPEPAGWRWLKEGRAGRIRFGLVEPV